jgi:hypothetical protein
MAIFVDTGAWYAISVPSDPDQVVARALMQSNRERLMTSDYIYDELLTLFRARGHMDRAEDWVNKLAMVDAKSFVPRKRISSKQLRYSSSTPTSSGASPTARAASSWNG